LTALRALRQQLGAMGLTDTGRYEIDFRLNTKERDYQAAVLAAHGLSFIAVANDGLVVAGQPIQVSVVASNRGPSDVSVTAVNINGFDSVASCTSGGDAKKDAAFSCTTAASVPATAKLTEPYFT